MQFLKECLWSQRTEEPALQFLLSSSDRRGQHAAPDFRNRQGGFEQIGVTLGLPSQLAMAADGSASALRRRYSCREDNASQVGIAFGDGFTRQVQIRADGRGAAQGFPNPAATRLIGNLRQELLA